jgi:outer membrane protein OmpA-like peptidoglycan-associated protein
MSFTRSKLTTLVFGLTLTFTPVIAQTNSTANNGSKVPARAVSSGQKTTIKGVIVSRDADTFTVRDLNGVDTVVRMVDNTKVEQKKGGLFGGSKRYPVTSILRGLNVEVKGYGDSSGQLVAERVKFNENDYKVARSIESRVDPVENRVGTAENRIGQVEQNAQRLSGQLEELAAVSNAAKGGAKAAQETADAALAGVRSTNERIGLLDDYEAQDTASIKFKLGSSVLSTESQTQLDEIAQKALASKGYVIEVLGFADATGSEQRNRVLSQRRADAVVRYLAEKHRIPLRRIITPYGLGESQAIADNTTREGRAENRRVEVKILINKGLQQGVATTPAAASN